MRFRLGTVLVASLQLAAAPLFGQTPVDAGKRLVEEGDFEAAIRVLDGAIKKLPADRSNSRQRAEAYLFLAYAYLGLSQEADARARFADALKEDPQLTLNPHDYPRRVIDLFEQVRLSQGLPPRRAQSAVSPQQSNLFFVAVKSGDFAAAKSLLKDLPALADERDAEFGATALHWAALKGHETVVALLLAQDADVNATNRDGETPLQVAQRANRTAIVRLLTQSGGSATSDGDIFTAVRAGDLAAVTRILDRDPARVRQSDRLFGATPLHWAALKGSDDVVTLLLVRGADANAMNAKGETPLLVAQRAKRTSVVRILQSAATSGGQSARSPASDDELIAAVRAGNVAAAQAALKRNPGAVSTPESQFGATPLHWAAVKGNPQMVTLLLSYGADRTAKNRAGETPLQVAERANKAEIVGLLR